MYSYNKPKRYPAAKPYAVRAVNKPDFCFDSLAVAINFKRSQPWRGVYVAKLDDNGKYKRMNNPNINSNNF